MKRKEFNEMVSKEINHLRTHATDEEKGRLDFENFDHNDNTSRIYGQMTLSCHSDRANALKPEIYAKISDKLGNDFSKKSFAKGASFTALEKYLFMVNSKKHLEIINYIKGDSQILLID
jgi:hypothetical protein